MIDYNLAWHEQFNYLHFNIIDSTSSEAKRIATSGRKGNFLIVGEEQTSGRGRQGRTWLSPKGNLYFSLLLQNPLTPEQAAQMIFVTSVALGESLALAVNNSDFPQIYYKWPNDLILEDAKLAGILLESNVKANAKHLDWLIIGIGVNYAGNLGAAAKNFPYPVTNLKAHGCQVSIDTILDNFMNSFISMCRLWSSKGFAPILDAWRKKAHRIGQMVSLVHNEKRYEGIFKDISNDGNIILTLPDNQEISFSTGEVFYNKQLSR